MIGGGKVSLLEVKDVNMTVEKKNKRIDIERQPK